MIESEYERYLPHLHDSGPREWGEQSRRLYWLTVRAGVAGRRAERTDIVAHLSATYDAYVEDHRDGRSKVPSGYPEGVVDGLDLAEAVVSSGSHLTARRSR
jgi:hypothetical protein